MKSRRMRWAGHVARVREERGVYRFLVGKPKGKRPLGRPCRRWVDNIRMDLQEVGCGYMDWVWLAQDTDRWRRLVSAVMNFGFREMRGISWLAANQLASQEGLCTLECIYIYIYIYVYVYIYIYMFNRQSCVESQRTRRPSGKSWVRWNTLELKLKSTELTMMCK